MHFTDEEVKHYFMPREGIIQTYVLARTEVAAGGKKKEVITDMLSYYSLPIQVFSHPKHNSIRVNTPSHRPVTPFTMWQPLCPTKT
jgi:hypothetical protein